MAAKEQKLRETQVLDWIREILKPANIPVGKDFQGTLKDGIVLCNLMNNLPGSKCGKYNKKAAGKFQQMENAQAVQNAMKAYGLPDEEIFQSVDLVEGRNIPQVTMSLLALARKAQQRPEYTGPVIGPKESTECKREFTQEQLNECKNTPRAW